MIGGSPKAEMLARALLRRARAASASVLLRRAVMVCALGLGTIPLAQCDKAPSPGMLAASARPSPSSESGDRFEDRFPAPGFSERFPTPGESLVQRRLADLDATQALA